MREGSWIESLGFRILGLGFRAAHNVEEFDDVRAPAEVLEDFDFPPNLLLLDRLEDLDNAAL